MSSDAENVGSLKQNLANVFEQSLRMTVPNDLDVEPLVVACSGNFGDYQCNNAMSLWARVKGKGTEFRGPPAVGQAIMKNIPPSEMIESCSVAGPGFVNIVLSTKWIAKSIQKMLIDGVEIWAPKLQIKRAVVDFSSPNIAKQMHVGHLRSTIIGDTLARMLEFTNVEVLRRNHVGDWGTQFGMLIEFLFEKFPNWEDATELPIGDLEAFYKESKKRFDEDHIFKKRAQEAVVSLQSGEHKYRKAWAQICEISRCEFEKVYKLLGIQLEEKAAKLAGWLPFNGNKFPKTSHVGFGLVCGEDGKRFRTRSSEVVRLVDLLDEAKNRCKTGLLERGKAAEWTEEELEKTAEAVGYGAVKYADLKNNRLTNYIFNFDQMLNDKGNTAVYLLYAHARICSIIRKSGKDMNDLKKTGEIVLDHSDERVLGLHLLQFAEIVEEACTNLLPNVLCEYLYNLSENFTKFYSNCQVLGSDEERSRLLLCEATAVVMRKCFYLLGITPVYKL